MHLAQRASREAFHAGALDAPIIEAFDLVTLVEALARDLNDLRGLHIEPPAAGALNGAPALHEHDSLETLVSKTAETSKADPRAPLEVRATVARCTLCNTGWTLEWSGDSQSGPRESARPFSPEVGFKGDEVDRIVAGIRAGVTVMVGGSRCHTTYRVGEGGELVAEDSDDGFTENKPCPESTLRQVILHNRESFLEVLREPLRVRLRDCLLDSTREAARACLGELVAFGDCLARTELLEAVLAWPEDKPTPDALARMTEGTTGLDLHHSVMSALGYGAASAAAGQLGLRFFSAVAEILGHERMPRFRRYRAGFRAMAEDLAGALDDLEWEAAHPSKDDPDAEVLQREIADLRQRL